MGYLMRMKQAKWVLAMLSLLMLTAIGRAETLPEIEYVNGERVFIKNPKWHAKEGGSWLFTCRLEVAAPRLVKPIAHLHLFSVEGEEEDAEIIWEHKAIVRRNKFDKSYGSRKARFMRVLIKDLPADLESLTVEFKNEPPNAKSSE